MITSFSELVDEARSRSGGCLVVAGADQESTLDGVVQARRKGLVDTVVLVDNVPAVKRRLKVMGESVSDYLFVDCKGEEAIATGASKAAADHSEAVLLKGRIPTDILLRSVLFGEADLRTGRTLSDVLVTENPVVEEPRLLGVTDGGVNVAPDLDVKEAIVKNAADLFYSLGVETPKVALLCASEKVSVSMPHTEEAQRLTELNLDGEVTGCVVDGPLALDNALSKECARKKGIDSPVAGRADILVAPTIEAGNILGKSFRYLANASMAHVIEGAKVPVLIPSRTESAEDKLYSIALGALRSGEEP